MTQPARLMVAVLSFLPLFAAFSYSHFYLSDSLSWLVALGESRPVELALLLVSPLLANFIGAAVFVLPIHWLYRQWAPRAALAIAVLTAAWQFSLMGAISGKPFVVVTWAIEYTCLVMFLPLAAVTLRRLRPNNSSKPTPLRGAA
jgi:hypothetical protein